MGWGRQQTEGLACWRNHTERLALGRGSSGRGREHERSRNHLKSSGNVSILEMQPLYLEEVTSH